MSIYLDKSAHIQVVINYPYSAAQMCTREDTCAHNLGALLGQVSTHTDRYQLPIFPCTTYSVCSFAHLLCVHIVFEQYFDIPFFRYLSFSH